MTKKTIAVFTGNRAEYGLQYPILRAIRDHGELEYRLIVSGAHLDPDFGRSISEIRDDGFEVHAEVIIDMNMDERLATAQAIGSGVISMTQALQDLQPDILVVYGDRFEGFAAVIAGTQMNTPTAHIEGGDITEGGALDDSVRHAMTKLAHFHFTTNQQATNRILCMGEEAWRVHTVGFPAIDMIADGFYARPEELQERFGIREGRPVVVFTQHSVTTEFEEAEPQLHASLDALSELVKEGTQVILTYPNNDTGGKAITRMLHEYAMEENECLQLHSSIGRYNYHGFLALAKNGDWRVVCAGNSSSGIKETPAFGCPTINIGTRQNGRLRGNNVIEVEYDPEAIHEAIKKGLFDDQFRRTCRNTSNPYGGGDAGIKIANILADIDIDRKRVLRKKMTLLGESKNGWFR